MNSRKDFLNLLKEVDSLVESTKKSYKAPLVESKKNGSSIAERTLALKRLSEEDTSLKDLSAKELDGLAKEKGKDSVGWSDKSDKPRSVPVASMANGKDGSALGMTSRLKDAKEDPLDNKTKGGKKVDETPESEEEPNDSNLDMPEEKDLMGEAMENLKRDWRRLMGEGSWSPRAGGDALATSLLKQPKASLEVSKKKTLNSKPSLAPASSFTKYADPEAPDEELDIPAVLPPKVPSADAAKQQSFRDHEKIFHARRSAMNADLKGIKPKGY